MTETSLECGHAETTRLALTKFLETIKSSKSSTFPHLSSTNFNENFKDNFVREKVTKMASKAKNFNIFTLESN